MKRSEVLNLIEGLFRLAMQEQSDEESHAENLLYNLEELGMLPPLSEGNYTYIHVGEYNTPIKCQKREWDEE